jgi:DNA-binding SARP family transcriptional activator/predicted ATPase
MGPLPLGRPCEREENMSGIATTRHASSAPRVDHEFTAPALPAARRHAIDVALLGGFEVRVDGQPIANAQWKLRHPRQLCQMLMLEPDGLSREQVLAVLWPDTDPAAAANRLHHTLHLLRGIFVAAGLPKSEPVAVLEAETVRLNPIYALEVDARAFLRCAAQARSAADAARAEQALQQALALHRGELAHGRPADEWLSERREAFRVEFAWVLDQLAAHRRAAGDDDGAIGLYQQLVDLDPGNELAHRALMELYAASGHPERAIHQYSVCKRQLQHELDVEPSPATQAVLQRIVSAPPGSGARAAGAQTQRWTHQAVPYAVPLLGREADVQALVERLNDPAVRLVTVTGAAGLGKSRVAHAALERVQAMFRNGAVVVSCAGLGDERQVASAIARALGMALASDGSAGAQLVERLRACQLLLLLDRFEHVLAAAPKLAGLLQAAPDVKALVTSQVALRVDGEQVLELPPLLQRDEAAALELFCRVAANAGAPIDGPGAREQAAAICRRLDGNPMAIELAAGQTPMLALPQILRALEQPLGVLTNPATDVEPQQRSLRDAITWTCSVLEPDAQGLLYALSVFGGQCGRDEPASAFKDLWPAAKLARCTQALLDMHLIRRQAAPLADGASGLEMPHAIAQFAAERLLEWPRREAVEAAHAAHAAVQVRACFRRMRDGGGDDSVGFTLYHRRSWVRAAFRLAQRSSAIDHLVMAYQFGVLALIAGATADAVAVLRAATERGGLASGEERRLAAWCTYRLARAYAWHADRLLTTRTIGRARRLAQAEGDAYLHDRCMLQLAAERIDQRRFRAARWHLQTLIDRHEAQGQARDLVRDHCLMASLRGAVGEAPGAVGNAQTALRIAHELGSEQHVAYAATMLCEACLRVGDMARAQQMIALCYALPDHAFTVLRRFHFRHMECAVDFENGDFDSTRAKQTLLLDSLQAHPELRTRIFTQASAEMLAIEQGVVQPMPMLDADFAPLPSGLRYDELTLRVLCYRIRRATALGRTRRALSTVQAAAQRLAKTRHPLWWAWTLEACALAAAMQGDAPTCRAAVALSRQALRRAGCEPTPRQQRNWAQALASAQANAPPADERSPLPMVWPKSDEALLNKLLAAMERALLEPRLADVTLG